MFVNGEKVEGMISVETLDRIIDQAADRGRPDASATASAPTRARDVTRGPAFAGQAGELAS